MNGKPGRGGVQKKRTNKKTWAISAKITHVEKERLAKIFHYYFITKLKKKLKVLGG